MSNFLDYVTSTAFALTISHRQIQCLCNIHHFGNYWALLTTFQALERKGLVERIKQDEQHKEGATIRLTDAGRACIPLLVLAGLYVEPPEWVHEPLPKAPEIECVAIKEPGQKTKIVFREKQPEATEPQEVN